jgi:hypothetical protein
VRQPGFDARIMTLAASRNVANSARPITPAPPATPTSAPDHDMVFEIDGVCDITGLDKPGSADSDIARDIKPKKALILRPATDEATGSREVRADG